MSATMANHRSTSAMDSVADFAADCAAAACSIE
jgi:hypothetical protein